MRTDDSPTRSTDVDEQTDLLVAACEHAGTELRSHRLRSVHHRAGRSVSHVHEATVAADGTEREVLLVIHTDTRGLPAEALVLERGRARVAVWRFPHDPYLPGLPSALHPGRVRELLDGLGVGPGTVGLRTRAYRPARRAVVEVTVAGDESAQRVLYFKVLVGDRVREVAEMHRQLAAHLPVPEVVGVAASQGILAISALSGHTLRDVLVAGGDVPSPGELIEVSRRLMASGLVSSRAPRAFADPTRHATRLHELAPQDADTIDRVAAAAGAVEGPEVVVHGDLHAGQLLVEDGRVTGLLDVDGAGTGLLAHDAGSLVAYLQVLGELHPAARDRVETYAEQVAEAYGPLVGRRELARAVAGAWLALATSAHRSQESDWQTTTRDRIARAAAALAA